MSVFVPIIQPVRRAPSCRVFRRDYTPLFSLWDDTLADAVRARHRNVPRFDVLEGHDFYVLEGELPGVDKKYVEIEIADEDTLTIRTTTNQTATGPAAEHVAAEDILPQDGDHAEEQCTTTEKHPSKKPFQAFVSEEDEWTEIETPATSESASETSVTLEDRATKISGPDDGKGKETAQAAQHDRLKPWSTSFSYSYDFPEHVDQDGVQATLENDLLKIIVPKLPKFERRHVIVE